DGAAGLVQPVWTWVCGRTPCRLSFLLFVSGLGSHPFEGCGLLRGLIRSTHAVRPGSFARATQGVENRLLASRRVPGDRRSGRSLEGWSADRSSEVGRALVAPRLPPRHRRGPLHGAAPVTSWNPSGSGHGHLELGGWRQLDTGRSPRQLVSEGAWAGGTARGHVFGESRSGR